ncbi:hypothetical protein [Janthinobacterium sp. HLX7-2]|uniref:hypothetical protein n=1 Tax=Janthinobacterium sp. HLX7-2 TaxID=1259331 RepID=UPI003F274431
MKKLLTFILIVMLACLFLDKIGATDMHMHFNGDDIDGPLEWLFGLVFAGGGLLIGAIALVFAAVVTGVVLAGVGMVVVAVVAFCVLLALALSTPVLLPLLIPAAIVWWLVSRNRKQARTQTHQQSL